MTSSSSISLTIIFSFAFLFVLVDVVPPPGQTDFPSDVHVGLGAALVHLRVPEGRSFQQLPVRVSVEVTQVSTGSRFQVDVTLVVHPGAKDQGTGHVHNVLRRHVTQRVEQSWSIPVS